MDMQYDPMTEQYLLGSIFADPARVWEVRQIVRTSDFAVPRNATLYEAVCAVADLSRLPSPVSVNDWLVQVGRAHEVPVEYAHEVDGVGAYGYQAMQYADIVRRHGERRKLAEAADAIRELAASGDDAGGDIIEKASGILSDLRGGTLRQSRPIGQVGADVIMEMREQVPHTPTPWPSLNAIIGGIKPGAMYTVAGRSGGGKSIFGLQLAQHVAETGGRVGYVSLEMTEKDLWKRLASMMQGIHQSALQHHQLTERGWLAVKEAESAIGGLPLEVYDRAGASWEDVTGFARALHRKGDLRLLVVDYLGLVKSPAGSRSRSQDLEGWANDAKALAKDLDCAVVLLEQLNRDSTGRKSPRPVVTDLRGTAALEHAADAIVLLHRPEKRINGKSHMTTDIEFIVPKNRQGTTGERTLRFEGEYARIVQKTEENTPLIEAGEV
ncbi:replicative DNA helicase [Leucobacter ruminantium]|uniref:DNA 5'-3' helicase n=1 Tax=Leucobacter ruminantium TaxID=1289170 RepID=A0A939LW52_9MICO|nr:replicative DNA helicase [Leucobacter ruminantium]MBO1805864.1 AAA family ATPase [Leucobacter ruminantium]